MTEEEKSKEAAENQGDSEKVEETVKSVEVGAEVTSEKFQLSDLQGLGEKKLAELKAAGITDVADLIGADAKDLASKTSFSEDKLKNWQKTATKKTPEILKEEIKAVGEDLEAKKEELLRWEPKTALGVKVKSGELSTIDEVLALPTPIKEVEVVDKLLPELSEEILNVGRVQRVTDSGRRMRFRVVTAVGNENGYVGVGEAKGKEAGPTIRKAIERAKINIISIKRGCGSWECGCGRPHTVPFKVSGKSGGVQVSIRPAPRGVGLVSGEIPRKVLSLAGISDAWVSTSGHTRTSLNFSHAIFNALFETNKVKVKESDIDSLNIISGKTQNV
ncbi:MAG: 30S ribosomal protein S5 [Methanobacteriota archaeon]